MSTSSIRLWLTTFVAIWLCFGSSAQTDPKYLDGAITFDAENKVSFTTTIKAPSLSQDQIFDLLHQWVVKRYEPGEVLQPRILLDDKAQGLMVVSGEEYLVFSSNAFSLDRSRIYYRLTLQCSNGEVTATMGRIRYWYDEFVNGGSKFHAEECIIDKYALNKKKTKLAYYYGKFRRGTIDLKNDIFEQIRTVLADATFEASKSSQPTVIATPEPAAQPVTVVIPTPVEEPTPGDIPADVALPQPTECETPSAPEVAASSQISKIAIVDDQGETLMLDASSWGGESNMFGKRVAYIIIDASKRMANAMLEDSESLTVQLFAGESSTPVKTISGQRMSRQSVTGNDVTNISSALNPDVTYNLYIIEVK